MQEVVELFKDAGVTIVVLAYFMYRDIKFMTGLQSTLTTLVELVRRMDGDDNGKCM